MAVFDLRLRAYQAKTRPAGTRDPAVDAT